MARSEKKAVAPKKPTSKKDTKVTLTKVVKKNAIPAKKPLKAPLAAKKAEAKTKIAPSKLSKAPKAATVSPKAVAKKAPVAIKNKAAPVKEKTSKTQKTASVIKAIKKESPAKKVAPKNQKAVVPSPKKELNAVTKAKAAVQTKATPKAKIEPKTKAAPQAKTKAEKASAELTQIAAPVAVGKALNTSSNTHRKSALNPSGAWPFPTGSRNV